MSMAKSGAAKTRHKHQDTTAARPVGDDGSRRQFDEAILYNEATRALDVRLVGQKGNISITVDCSSWLVAPGLAFVFARASLEACKGLMLRTKEAHFDCLTYGIFAWLNSSRRYKNLTIEGLTTRLLREVVQEWIGRKQEDGSYQFKYDNRNHQLGAIRKVINHLKANGPRLLPDDCDVPRNPWPGGAKVRRAPKTSDPAEEAAFWKYCRDSAAAEMAQVEGIWRSADEALRNNPNIAEKPLLHRARTVGMAYLRVIYLTGGYLPEQNVLEATSPELYGLTKEFGYVTMARSLAPYAKDLAKYVLLLAYATLLNEQPLVNLEVTKLEVKTVLDTKRLLIKGVKNRAGKTLRLSFAESPESDNPYRIVEFLRQWTARIRELCPKELASHLWLYVPRDQHGEVRVNTYHDRGRGKPVNFRSHLQVFCRAGGFKWKGLREIRMAGAEIADQLFGGDIRQTSELLQHSGMSVTEKHYRSGAAQRRMMEQLVVGMSQRDRWVLSDGKFDPRNAPTSDELSAATPAFRCLDPLDSPIPGERQGRLCGAFGKCSACPLGSVDVRSPYALARLLQLQALHHCAREELGEKAWRLRWGESYDRLVNFWLPQFTEEAVLREAEQLLIPPLPPLD